MTDAPLCTADLVTERVLGYVATITARGEVFWLPVYPDAVTVPPRPAEERRRDPACA